MITFNLKFHVNLKIAQSYYKRYHNGKPVKSNLYSIFGNSRNTIIVTLQSFKRSTWYTRIHGTLEKACSLQNFIQWGTILLRKTRVLNSNGFYF